MLGGLVAPTCLLHRVSVLCNADMQCCYAAHRLIRGCLIGSSQAPMLQPDILLFDLPASTRRMPLLVVRYVRKHVGVDDGPDSGHGGAALINTVLWHPCVCYAHTPIRHSMMRLSVFSLVRCPQPRSLLHPPKPANGTGISLNELGA